MDGAEGVGDPADRCPSHPNPRPAESSAFDKISHHSQVGPLWLRRNAPGSLPSHHRMDEQPQREVESIPDHAEPTEANEKKANRYRADTPRSRHREQSPVKSAAPSVLRRRCFPELRKRPRIFPLEPSYLRLRARSVQRRSRARRMCEI